MEAFKSTEDIVARGGLEAGIASLADLLKKDPSLVWARCQLVELLCFAERFEDADNQLNTLVSLDSALILPMSVWRNLIAAAQKRIDVYECKETPDVVEEPTEEVAQRLNFLVSLKDAEEDLSEQVAKLDADSTMPPGLTVNDAETYFRNLDDLSAYHLEVLATNGKYYWVDFAQIESLEVFKPERLIEVLWRKARLILTNGSDGEVYLPAAYVGKSSQEALLAGRTDWIEQQGLVRGEGLQMWLAGEEDVITIDELSSMEVAETASA